jgi:UDP-3-O-[3-hydroxymyristoyl] glucosamine N-acyltransferase
MTTFDFGDSNGMVPAHRHINPDGSIGGWVADTAFVEESVYMGGDARVFGLATIDDNVQVFDESEIYGEAYICDNARIYGKAKIYGDAFIFGNLNVNESVDLLKNICFDYKNFNPISIYSSEDDFLRLSFVAGDEYDFDDGWGEQPANRHINPDGKIGGWVAESAFVDDTVYLGFESVVFDDAFVRNNARIDGNARIYGDARIFDNVLIYGDVSIYDNAQLSNDVQVFDNAKIYGNARIYDDVLIYENASVYGDTQLTDNVRVFGNSRVYGNAELYDYVIVQGNAKVYGNVKRSGRSIIGRKQEPITVKETSKQSTGFKIPPPPEPLQFNAERVAEIKTESKKISVMLNEIYEQEDNLSAINNTADSKITSETKFNLDKVHIKIVEILITRPKWERDELQSLLNGVMLDCALEHINDAFFDCCNEAFIEGDDLIEINIELYEEFFK